MFRSHLSTSRAGSFIGSLGAKIENVTHLATIATITRPQYIYIYNISYPKVDAILL